MVEKYRHAFLAGWSWEGLSRHSDDKVTVCLTEKQIAALLPIVTNQMQWKTRWTDGDIEDYRAFAFDLYLNLTEPERCQSGDDESGGKCERALPDCITIDEKGNICIEGEDCMGNIYIYNGCGCNGGCGCQSGGSTGSGNDGIGSLSSQPDLEGAFTPGGDRVTLCDTATTLVPYLISQFREFVNSVDSTLDAGGDLVDLIGGGTIGAIDLTDVSNNTIEFLSDLLSVVAEPAIDVFDDSDFLLRAQEIWWATFSGRTDWTSVSRDDIRLWTSRLPITWGNILTAQAVSPRLVAYSIAAVLDMPKVNRQLRVAKATAETGLCEYLASQNGETFTPNPVIDPPDERLVGTFEVASQNYAIYDLSYQVLNENETGNLLAPSGTLAGIAGQYLSTVATDFPPNFQVQSPVTPGNYVVNIGRSWAGNFEDGNARTALELAGFVDASNASQALGGPVEFVPFTVTDGIPYDGGEGGSNRDRHPADLTLYIVYKV